MIAYFSILKNIKASFCFTVFHCHCRLVYLVSTAPADTFNFDKNKCIVDAQCDGWSSQTWSQEPAN